MSSHCRRPLLTLSLLLMASTATFASPTGLNNIPTADVVPQDVLVLQEYGNLGPGPGTSYLGFKYGPIKNLEVGVDGAFSGAGANTNPAFQIKYRVPYSDTGAIAGGIANVTSDTNRNGQAFDYLVVSQGLGGGFHGHVGYSFQNNNEAWFAGADDAITKKLTLRADWIQTNNGQQSLSSFGLIDQLADRWLVESWASFPSAGAATTYTLKFDYVIKMK